MKKVSRMICRVRRRTILLAFVVFAAASPQRAQELSLEAVVTPSTVIVKNGEPVKFAIHGFIEFKSLAEVFAYVEGETRRWDGKISKEEMQKLARQLLHKGI